MKLVAGEDVYILLCSLSHFLPVYHLTLKSNYSTVLYLSTNTILSNLNYHPTPHHTSPPKTTNKTIKWGSSTAKASADDAQAAILPLIDTGSADLFSASDVVA